jgi:hypothetical protein
MNSLLLGGIFDGQSFETKESSEILFFRKTLTESRDEEICYIQLDDKAFGYVYGVEVQADRPMGWGLKLPYSELELYGFDSEYHRDLSLYTNTIS